MKVKGRGIVSAESGLVVVNITELGGVPVAGTVTTRITTEEFRRWCRESVSEIRVGDEIDLEMELPEELVERSYSTRSGDD